MGWALDGNVDLLNTLTLLGNSKGPKDRVSSLTELRTIIQTKTVFMDCLEDFDQCFAHNGLVYTKLVSH